MTTKSIKMVTVGDGAVGKTCLLISYSNSQYPLEYVPTVFDTNTVNLTVNNEDIELGLWDTAGEEEYDRFRPLLYLNTNVFAVCFSIINHNSYENIKSKWIPEVKHCCPTVPFVLIGTKIDLRDNIDIITKLESNKKEPITYEQGLKLAKEIGAYSYVECSSKTYKGLKSTFKTIIQASQQTNQRKSFLERIFGY